MDALLHVLVPIVVLTAQAEPTGIDDALMEYGLLGIFAIVAGLLIRKFLTDQRADLVETRNQRDALVKDMFDLVIPAVAKMTDLMERVEHRLEDDR